MSDRENFNAWFLEQVLCGKLYYDDEEPAERAWNAALAQPSGEGQHDSDCSLHNEPAYPNGPCDCSLSRSAAHPQPASLPKGFCLVPIELPDEMRQAAMMALLQCSASELGDYSARLFDVYANEVDRVHAAILAQSGK